ncbi:MAG: hypothetical protein HC878_19610 [Leptolyngbyaceae cyanobacterium SL_5_14]|nr:hypothetical protein [Leptolyngbyaceae cyanobacterium SL_5_14]
MNLKKLCRLIAKKLQSTPNIESDQLVADIRASIEADPDLIAAIRIDRRMIQNNQGETTAFQTLVESGIAYIGTHYHFDDTEKIKEVLELLLQQYVSENPQNIYANRFPSFGQHQQENGFNMLAFEFENSNFANILNMAACGGISELAQVSHLLRKLIENQHHDEETEESSKAENHLKLPEKDIPEVIEIENTENSVDSHEGIFLEHSFSEHEIGVLEDHQEHEIGTLEDHYEIDNTSDFEDSSFL